MIKAAGGWKDGGMVFTRETHRTEPIPGCADTAGSRQRRPDTTLRSRNVLDLVGETSAGNRLMYSQLHTGCKPPESGLSKRICVGAGHAAAEGVNPPPPSWHQYRSQEDLLHGFFIRLLLHERSTLLPRPTCLSLSHNKITLLPCKGIARDMPHHYFMKTELSKSVFELHLLVKLLTVKHCEKAKLRGGTVAWSVGGLQTNLGPSDDTIIPLTYIYYNIYLFYNFYNFSLWHTLKITLSLCNIYNLFVFSLHPLFKLYVQDQRDTGWGVSILDLHPCCTVPH